MVPLGYELKDGKILLVEHEAEPVRTIFRRYLELSSVNQLVLDLQERCFRTKIRVDRGTRGGLADRPCRPR
jgi:site-specific DNA recombinase